MVVNSSPSGLLGPRSSSNNKYVVSIFLSLLVMVANATSISETEAKSPIESYPKSPDYSPVNTKMVSTISFSVTETFTLSFINQLSGLM